MQTTSLKQRTALYDQESLKKAFPHRALVIGKEFIYISWYEQQLGFRTTDPYMLCTVDKVFTFYDQVPATAQDMEIYWSRLRGFLKMGYRQQGHASLPLFGITWGGQFVFVCPFCRNHNSQGKPKPEPLIHATPLGMGEFAAPCTAVGFRNCTEYFPYFYTGFYQENLRLTPSGQRDVLFQILGIKEGRAGLKVQNGTKVSQHEIAAQERDALRERLAAQERDSLKF